MTLKASQRYLRPPKDCKKEPWKPAKIKKTARKVEVTDSEWESTFKAALRPKKAPMKKTAPKFQASKPQVDGKSKQANKTPVKTSKSETASGKYGSPSLPLLKAKKIEKKKRAEDDDDKEESIPVDWDPVDVALWNATDSPNGKMVKLHSSSPLTSKHKRSNAVGLDLFPEVFEESEDEEEDGEESEEDRTHMQRGGVQSNIPSKASSPATSPPRIQAELVSMRNCQIGSEDEKTPSKRTRRGRFALDRRLSFSTPRKLEDDAKKCKFEIVERAIVRTRELSSASQLPHFGP